MPLYRYKVRDASGQAVVGSMNMDSAEAIAKYLEDKGYLPISIEEAKRMGILNPAFFGGRMVRVRDKDINFFTRQLVTLTKAGVPLVGSLETLNTQATSRGLQIVITALLADLDRGDSFSAALSHHSNVFSELYTAMTRVGEATGHLDEVLMRLAEMGEYETEIKAKIGTALFYPKLIVGVMFMAFIFITTFVLPKFVGFFEQAGVELLPTTKFLLWLNFVFRNYWYLAVAVIGSFIFLIRYLVNTPWGREFWDGFKLKIPIFGPLFHQFAMARFTRTFSVTSRSGVPVLESLEIVSHSVGNVVISKEIAKIREAVRAGEGLGKPMAKSRVFPPIVVRMVSVGEETGKIDELLMRVSEFYDFEMDNAIKKLTIMIEPILLVVLGGMVLFLILSIFVPLLHFYTKVASGGR